MNKLPSTATALLLLLGPSRHYSSSPNLPPSFSRDPFPKPNPFISHHTASGQAPSSFLETCFFSPSTHRLRLLRAQRNDFTKTHLNFFDFRSFSVFWRG